MDNLAKLLADVDELFSKDQGKGTSVYNYTLGRFPEGWNFSVRNSWYKWSARGLQYEFFYNFPENAVKGFLQYVRDNKIDVAKLME